MCVSRMLEKVGGSITILVYYYTPPASTFKTLLQELKLSYLSLYAKEDFTFQYEALPPW